MTSVDSTSEPRRRILVPVGITRGAERLVADQQALARNEVHFQADAVGILEHDVVVAGRPIAGHRPAIDVGSHLPQLGGDGIDVLARAGANAEMMQADAAGDEALTLVLGRATLDADRGAAADVIEEVVAVIDLGEAEDCLLYTSDAADE